MNNEQAEYVNWMNSLLRPGDDLAKGLEQLARLKTENAELRAIVQIVANADTTYYDDFEDLCCIFCHGQDNYLGDGHESYTHEPECIVLKARALVKEHSS